MKFQTLEEFLTHIITNSINIADVEFTLPEVTATSIEAPAATADVLAEPPPPADENDDKKPVIESVILHFASGDVQAEVDETGVVVVESCSMVPNSCGTGKLTVAGRTMYLSMCGDDTSVTAYLDATVNGVRDASSAVRVRARA